MAQLEVVLEIKGTWRFKVCMCLTKIYITAIRMTDIFIPRPSRNAGKKTIFLDLVPTIREAN